jgi:hypothetical protein
MLQGVNGRDEEPGQTFDVVAVLLGFRRPVS